MATKPVSIVARLTASLKQEQEKPTPRDVLPVPSFRYVDEFLKIPGSSLLIEHKLFPSTKDLVESVALVTHWKNNFGSSAALRDTLIVVVGDGETPRTSCLFALMYPQAQVLAVDPALFAYTKKPKLPWSNLRLLSKPIRRVRIKGAKLVFLILAHAHCSLADALCAVEPETLRGVIACPCCDWYDSLALLKGKEASIETRDKSICSKDNLIRIWKTQDLQISLSIERKSLLGDRTFSNYRLESSIAHANDPGTRPRAIGIISHVRRLPKFLFFDLWQCIEEEILAHSVLKLSHRARQGMLPKRQPLPSQIAEVETMLQCCIRQSDQARGLIKSGNLVVCSGGKIDFSTVKRARTWFVDGIELLVHHEELNVAIIDYS